LTQKQKKKAPEKIKKGLKKNTLHVPERYQQAKRRMRIRGRALNSQEVTYKKASEIGKTQS